MDDLRELYQEVILDHNRHPRNFAAMEDCTYQAEGYNPLCGDHLTLYVKTEGDQIKDLSFQGSGCAISKASASLMTESLKGKSKTEALDLFNKFHQMVTGSLGQTLDSSLGKLAVFAGVCEFPARVKCASLAWHTLKNALEGKATVAKTEE